jgi:hypothetical protein
MCEFRALSNLGHALAHGTIANILKRSAIDSAGTNSEDNWKEFLAQH